MGSLGEAWESCGFKISDSSWRQHYPLQFTVSQHGFNVIASLRAAVWFLRSAQMLHSNAFQTGCSDWDETEHGNTRLNSAIWQTPGSQKWAPRRRRSRQEESRRGTSPPAGLDGCSRWPETTSSLRCTHTEHATYPKYCTSHRWTLKPIMASQNDCSVKVALR